MSRLIMGLTLTCLLIGCGDVATEVSTTPTRKNDVSVPDVAVSEAPTVPETVIPEAPGSVALDIEEDDPADWPETFTTTFKVHMT